MNAAWWKELFINRQEMRIRSICTLSFEWSVYSVRHLWIKLSGVKLSGVRWVKLSGVNSMSIMTELPEQSNENW